MASSEDDYRVLEWLARMGGSAQWLHLRVDTELDEWGGYDFDIANLLIANKVNLCPVEVHIDRLFDNEWVRAFDGPDRDWHVCLPVPPSEFDAFLASVRERMALWRDVSARWSPES